jgi:hypothetical protein
MTYTQTVEIPQSRRLIIDLPSEIPTGKAVIMVDFKANPAESTQNASACRLSERFAGALRVSDDRYAEMQQALQEERDEWNRNIL